MAKKGTPKKKAKHKYHTILYGELPINARGDRTPEPLALAVASALSAWELMDERLSFLFSVLVQSRNGGASAAYGSMTSFGAQLRMIRAASEAVFRRDHPIRPRIETLVNELDKLHGKRSNIAHGIIRQYMKHTTDKNGRRRSSANGYFLSPPMHNTKKQISIDDLNDLMSANPKFFGEFHRWRKHAYTSKQVARIEKVINSYPSIIMDIFTDVQAEMKKREREAKAKEDARREAIRATVRPGLGG